MQHSFKPLPAASKHSKSKLMRTEKDYEQINLRLEKGKTPMIKTIPSFLLLLLLNCTQHLSIDLSVSFCGDIRANDNSSIDSAKIEVLDIEGAGHNSMADFTQKTYYSDTNGSFCINLPSGVEWDEKPFSDSKEYTKYISSAAIKVSKESFKDTVFTFRNTNYEESIMNITIVLQ